MKTIYILEDNEDDDYKKHCMEQSIDMMAALCQIRNNLRQIWKHEELSNEVWNKVDEIYGMFHREAGEFLE